MWDTRPSQGHASKEDLAEGGIGPVLEPGLTMRPRLRENAAFPSNCNWRRFSEFSQELGVILVFTPSRKCDETRVGTEPGRNWPEVLQRQVHNYSLRQTIFHSAARNLEEMTKKPPAAFVEDDLVIMGWMATLCHLMAAAAALPPAPLAAPTPP